MSSTAMRALERADELERLQELIYDITFRFGLEWAKLEEEFRGKVMDHVDGSRGLKDHIVLWAKQFDRLEAYEDDYIGKIDDFAVAKFQQLCGEVGKKIFAERLKIADPATERAKAAEQAKQAIAEKIKLDAEEMRRLLACQVWPPEFRPSEYKSAKEIEEQYKPRSLFNRIKF